MDYSAKNHITEQALSDLDIRSRVLKNAEEQVLRTRKRAEVFTPACHHMVSKTVFMINMIIDKTTQFGALATSALVQ